MGIRIRDWDGLFKEMNDEDDNLAYVRTTEDGDTIDFILFKPTKFTSWFYKENRYRRAFYKKHGYFKAPGCKAKNQDNVFIRRLQ
ncbi:MAG: hypothetical protein K2O91_11725 [Lachnospiraceae bacterium]|nr:hypothetical protein [Lachnospiraceae bacterium]